MSKQNEARATRAGRTSVNLVKGLLSKAQMLERIDAARRSRGEDEAPKE